MKNALGKEDTAFTVQYDLCLPVRFDLKYINEEGKEERPVVIHRSSIGCIERTMAFLIEKYAGIFPLWLAPEQVRIIPVSTDKHLDYANKIKEELLKKEFRVKVDDAPESVGKKIRNAELMKVNYMIIVGDKDIEAQTVSVRPLQGEDMGAMPLADFIKIIKKERDTKAVVSKQ
jgi:threonyl-tRNA synthetase